MTPISICVIAKNEEKNINTFLSSIKKSMNEYPYEIVLVDTGSSDNTVDIADRYECKLFTFQWADDFSAARNFSIKCATNDWILILDCDEYLIQADTSCFDQMIQQFPNGVGLITRHNHCLSAGNNRVFTDQVNRFFNKRLYHYEDIIHEQLVANDQNPYQLVTIPLVVDHVGYIGSQEELLQKANRNNKLLFRALKESPNDPYLYFQLGQSYNMINDSKNAYIYYKKGLEYTENPHIEYVSLMVLGYGESMIKLGLYEEALSLEKLKDKFDTTPEFACLMGNIYLYNKQYVNAMKEFLKATTYPYAEMEGSNTYIPLYRMGYINEILGDTASAKKLYESCGDYPAARKRLHFLSDSETV